MKTAIYVLCIFSFLYTSCNINISDPYVVNLELSTKSEILLLNYQDQYGFEEIKTYKLDHPDFNKTISIKAINGKQLPETYDNKKHLTYNLANDMINTLDKRNMKGIEKVVVTLSEEEGLLWMTTSHSERFEYMLDEKGNIRDGYLTGNK